MPMGSYRADRINDLLARRDDFKTEHTTETTHLPFGDFMVGVGRQPRIVNGADF